MRTVCDTNVLISALIWGGTPGKIWDRVESGADRLFVSQPMLDELARVLGYPRIARVLLRRSLQPGNILGAVVKASDVVWPRALAAPVVPSNSTCWPRTTPISWMLRLPSIPTRIC